MPVGGEPLELRECVSLVTGAGRGIGLATARELSARDSRGLVLVDLPGDELDAAAAGFGDRAIAVAADVTDAEAMRGAVAAALERFGALEWSWLTPALSGSAPCGRSPPRISSA